MCWNNAVGLFLATDTAARKFWNTPKWYIWNHVSLLPPSISKLIHLTKWLLHQYTARLFFTNITDIYAQTYNHYYRRKGIFPWAKWQKKVVAVIRFSENFFLFIRSALSPTSRALHISVLTAVLGEIKTILWKTLSRSEVIKAESSKNRQTIPGRR